MTIVNDAQDLVINSMPLEDLYSLIRERAGDADYSVTLPKVIVEPHLAQLLLDGYKVRGYNRSEVEVSWHVIT